MKLRKRGRRICAVLFASFLLPGVSLAAPAVDNVIVTDVTTRAFSVIWTSSEASTPTIEVYEFADESGGLVGVAEAFPVHCNSSLQNVAENMGVMKVQVTGLNANTTYYYKTITDSATGQTVYPDPGDALLEVNTATLTVRADSSNLPFSNDIIISDWTMTDGITPADGTLAFASVTGGAYPVTAFVGDCAPSGSALIDLNNVFDRSTKENLDLNQGVNLNLVNFRGTDGVTQVVHKVPLDNLLAEVKNADPGLEMGWNMMSLPIEPYDSTTTSVLSPIWDEFDQVWTVEEFNSASWLVQDKLGGTIPNLETRSGYWLKTVNETSLPIEGSMIGGSMQLHSGWNLVGNRSIKTLRASEVHNSMIDLPENLVAIWSKPSSLDDWLFYDAASPAGSTLVNIEPGKAYWVQVSGECSWSF